jgi:hypothetical protein
LHSIEAHKLVDQEDPRHVEELIYALNDDWKQLEESNNSHLIACSHDLNDKRDILYEVNKNLWISMMIWMRRGILF